MSKKKQHFGLVISILANRHKTMKTMDKRKVDKEIFYETMEQIEQAIKVLRKEEEK